MFLARWRWDHHRRELPADSIDRWALLLYRSDSKSHARTISNLVKWKQESTGGGVAGSLPDLRYVQHEGNISRASGFACKKIYRN
jgi:hypothetical protein